MCERARDIYNGCGHQFRKLVRACVPAREFRACVEAEWMLYRDGKRDDCIQREEAEKWLDVPRHAAGTEDDKSQTQQADKEQ